MISRAVQQQAVPSARRQAPAAAAPPLVTSQDSLPTCPCPPPIFRLSYHCWYYSWHLWIGQGNGSGVHLYRHTGGYHRLDQTGQSARQLFTLVRSARSIKLLGGKVEFVTEQHST